MTRICLIVGCLNRRITANLCSRHERMSSDPDWQTDADAEEWAREQVAAERVAKHTARQEQSTARATAREETADELAIRLLLLASLEGAVAQSIRDTKDLLAARMTAGDMKRPRLGDLAAGTVTYANGPVTVTVDDEAALTEWVLQHYTTEIELITRVRPAFMSRILEATKAAGQPAGPGGELDIPGLSVRSGTPRVVARPDRAHAAELWLRARANPLSLITSQERPS